MPKPIAPESAPPSRWRGAANVLAGLLLAVVAGALLCSGAVFAQTTTSFDHARTGFALTGTHQSVKCESCHVRGIFKGTPNQCATCHAAGSRISAVTVTANHVPTTQTCDTCHTTSTFAGVMFSHVAVTPGTCATCHNNFTATGKPVDHPITTLSCDTCHKSTSSFAAGVTVKPANHIPSTQQCTLCHAGANATPPAYNPGIMNHAGITSGCAACHAAAVASTFFGVTVTAPPPTHIPSGSAPCEGCHAATNFGTFSGTPMNHAVVTNVACSTCHETGKSFFGVTIVTRPTSAQDPAHPSSGECSNCHKSTTSFTAGITALPANHIPTGAPCTQCHSGATYATTISNAAIHVGIAAGCSTCHGGAAPIAFLNVTPKSQVAGHLPTAQSCEVCHAGSLPSATSFAGGVMNHAGIASGCAACHSAATAPTIYGVSVKAPPSNHVPVGAAACEGCHASTNFSTFGGTAMNHAAAGFSATPCATCHENGDASAFYGVTIVTRPTTAQDANHPQTGDCSGCHVTTSFTTLNQKPSNHIPTSAACTQCHATTNYATYTLSGIHVGISAGCITCHGAAAGPFANIVPKQPPTGSPAHIPTGSEACEDCHKSTASFAGTAMVHTATVTAGLCDACHEAGMSWYGVSIVTRPGGSHPKAPQDCKGCHNTTNFNQVSGKQLQPGARAATVARAMATAPSRPMMPLPGAAPAATSLPSATVVPPSPGRTLLAGHAGVAPGTCITCHNGSNATGRPAGHIATTMACDACHRTTAWLPAIFNHARVAAACGSCHNGLSASGKPPSHMITLRDCQTCHVGTASWEPVRYLHQQAAVTIAAGAQPCFNCHVTHAETIARQPLVGRPQRH